MRPKKPANRDLPPRMIRRVRKLKSGEEWIGYYYAGRDDTGKRKEIPLGTDADEARVKWAQLERKQVPLAAESSAGLSIFFNELQPFRFRKYANYTRLQP